jgi:hypothetical protein
MRYAKSMYLAGDIVDAIACDYESARKLGLVCPFCSQAVFLRVGNYHERKGKPVIVSDSFAHYHSDDPLALDCELRSRRPEGKQYLANLRGESREQRLKLYNARLWELIKGDLVATASFFKPDKTSLGAIRKLYGQEWVEASAIAARRELERNLEFYLEEVSNRWEEVCRNPEGVFCEGVQDYVSGVLGRSPEDAKRAIASVVKKRIELSHYQRLIGLIIREVTEFLATRTGGYAFERLFTYCLGYCHNVSLRRNSHYGSASNKALHAAVSDAVKRSFTTQQSIEAIAWILIQVDWIAVFKQVQDSQEAV